MGFETLSRQRRDLNHVSHLNPVVFEGTNHRTMIHHDGHESGLERLLLGTGILTLLLMGSFGDDVVHVCSRVEIDFVMHGA